MTHFTLNGSSFRDLVGAGALGAAELVDFDKED